MILKKFFLVIIACKRKIAHLYEFRTRYTKYLSFSKFLDHVSDDGFSNLSYIYDALSLSSKYLSYCFHK